MPIYRIKRSLASGELAPLMYGRTDLPSYKNGCRTFLNSYIKPQGPAVRRSGTQFIANMTDYFTTYMGEDILEYRLVDFVFDETQAYCIIFLFGATTGGIFFASYDAVNGIYGLIEDPASPGNPYNISYLYTAYNLQHADFDYAQTKDVLVIAHVDTTPLQLSRIDHDNWAFSDITFSGGIPTDWNATDGYPRHVTFYEARLVLAATLTLPQTLWFSETGNYWVILPAASPAGTDPFFFTIKSERHNQIQWLASSTRLSVGSIGDEWVVTGSTDGFSAETVNVNRQSAKGSEAIRPIMSGSTTLYVERLGRNVNEFVYDYRTASYSSINLSILSPHLTDSYPIVRWAHQVVPNGIVWCVMENGNVITLTYQREHEVTGWTRHDTQGLFKDVCCIPDEVERETNVWFLIEREINGSTVLYLERLTKEFVDQESDYAWMVDCALQYDNPGTPITNVTGLDHLEGETVSVLTNGAVHPDVVVSGGSIDLNFESDIFVIGLSYISRIVPLPTELELNDGTGFGREKRITNMSVYLRRSLGMWIGRELDEMEEVPFRVPTDLTGQGVPLFSGIRKVAFPEGYDNYATIIIEQRQPLPMMIVSIIDESEVYT